MQHKRLDIQRISCSEPKRTKHVHSRYALLKLCKIDHRRTIRNFREQGSNPRKKAHFNCLKKIRPLNTVLKIHKRRKQCGKFTGMATSEIQ